MTTETKPMVITNDASLAALGLTEFKQVTEVDDYSIMSFGDVLTEGTEREENVIYAGETVVGEFIGTVPMWSTEPKENWKEEEAEGRKYWTSLHYKFLDVKSKKPFGIFGSSTLFNLQKIATSETDPALTNPVVGVRYLGKIEGKEILEKEHGIVLTKGTSAHVAKLLTTPLVVIDPYFAGCCNYTRNPLPNFGTKTKMSKIDQAKANFAAQEARRELRDSGNVSARIN